MLYFIDYFVKKAPIFMDCTALAFLEVIGYNFHGCFVTLHYDECGHPITSYQPYSGLCFMCDRNIARECTCDKDWVAEEIGLYEAEIAAFKDAGEEYYPCECGGCSHDACY